MRRQLLFVIARDKYFDQLADFENRKSAGVEPAFVDVSLMALLLLYYFLNCFHITDNNVVVRR